MSNAVETASDLTSPSADLMASGVASIVTTVEDAEQSVETKRQVE